MTIARAAHQIGQLTYAGLATPRLWAAVLLGAAVTWLLSTIGIDARINDLARYQNELFSIGWSAFPMLAGMVVPALVPLILALLGNSQLAIKTAAAFLIALSIVSLLKGFTSRIHPESLEPATSLLRSQSFRFGFLEHGLSSLVEGWPSGHTATNGAVGLTIAQITTNSLVKSLSLFWVIWVALATVFGISGDVHWLSDTIAGGLVAWAIASRL